MGDGFHPVASAGWIADDRTNGGADDRSNADDAGPDGVSQNPDDGERTTPAPQSNAGDGVEPVAYGSATRSNASDGVEPIAEFNGRTIAHVTTSGACSVVSGSALALVAYRFDGACDVGT
jgi:hypothetical protein